jgi:hypothetical protein
VREIGKENRKHHAKYLVVDFTARDGSAVSARVKDVDWENDPRIGGLVYIRYAPQNPHHDIQEAGKRPHFVEPLIWAIVDLGVAVLYVYVGMSHVRNRGGRKIGLHVRDDEARRSL